MNTNDKIKLIIETHREEVDRLNKVLAADRLTVTGKKMVLTQILHSKKAIDRLTGRLEKKGVLINQAVKVVETAPSKTRKKKAVPKTKK